MSETSARKYASLLVLMALPAFALAQHKGGSAPHVSAPAHASAPAPRASAPSHNASPMGHPGNSAGRPGNTMGGNRGGNTLGNRGGNTMGNRTGNNTMGSRPNNTMGNRPNNTVGNRNGMGNTGHPANSNLGHGTTNGGRPTTTTGNHSATGGAGAGKGAASGMNHGNTTAGHAGGAGNTHAAISHTPPGRQVSLKGGGTAQIRPNGQIRSVNRNGMQINHGLHGGRTVVSTHNGARVVTTGRRGGYVQRNYVSRNGSTYVSRTYVVNNVSYTSVYRSYGYGGYCCYYGYAPAYYWHPAYYGWAYNPWPAPVYYGWGWGGAPWYGYYGPYFQPYPVYPSAYFWLTDYLVAASLRAAYEAQAEEAGELSPLTPDPWLVAGLGPVPVPDAAKVQMSKEVKDQLAEEVKAQLAEEKGEAAKGKDSGGGGKASGPPPALDPKRRIFVVNDEVTSTVDGQECSLTAGDVISRVNETPDTDRNVDVKVLASKKADCAVGKQLSVAVDDLQEMHNHFREQVSGGMDELSKKQGTGGLPKAPDTGKQDGEVPAPPADSSAAKTLKEQQSAADQTEADVKKEAGSSSGGVQ
jgi:hypothetical protein